MKFHESPQHLALLAALPAFTIAAPADPPREPQPGDRIVHGLTYPVKPNSTPQQGVCGHVPKWINDAAAYEKLVGEPVQADNGGSGSASPGSARTCLDMAWELEWNNRYSWKIATWDTDKELIRKDRCNFNVSPFQGTGWIVKFEGRDVADIIRDAVRQWCPDSYHLESGVMIGNADESGDCPLMGHGIVDDCDQVAHGSGTSSLLWYIGAHADRWTDEGQYNAPDYGGWSGGPI